MGHVFRGVHPQLRSSPVTARMPVKIEPTLRVDSSKHRLLIHRLTFWKVGLEKRYFCGAKGDGIKLYLPSIASRKKAPEEVGSYL